MIHRKVFSALLVLLATLVASPVFADSECKLQRVAKLDMGMEAAGRTTVPMLIAGHSMNMAIDTGGVSTMITDRQVRALGLRTSLSAWHYLVGFGGYVSNTTVTTDIQLGTMKAADRKLFVMPDKSDNIDGLLAPDILRAFDLDFDFANATFSLFSQDHCPGKAVYWTDQPAAQIPFKVGPEGHIVLNVQLDGKDTPAMLDTGASRSVFTLATARQLFGIREDDPKMVKVKVTGILHYPFKTLVIGGLTVNNPDFDMFPTSMTGRDPRSQMILGMGVIRQLHLYVAYKEGYLYLTPASAH